MRWTALAFVALAASAPSSARSLAAPGAGAALVSPLPGTPDRRAFYSMSVLPSGKVLVAGGRVLDVLSAEAYLFDPASGAWTQTGAMATARAHHAAVLLRDGRVLVAGGGGAGAGAAVGLASAEIYDPSTGTWSATGSMATSRYYFSATPLRDGTVLVAGGVHPEEVDGSPVYGETSSCERYDPSTGAWSAVEPLASARLDHTATLLGDGRVLVVGGRTGGLASRSAELFDPALGSWSPAAPTLEARYLHTATRLSDGVVLVVGGVASAGGLTTAERYNPFTDTWLATGSLATGRFAHAASLLPTDEVVVSGGFGFEAVATAERYDPSTKAWIDAGTLGAARAYLETTVLYDARILVGPGWKGAGTYVADVDLLDLSAPSWGAGPPLDGSRRLASAVLLPSYDVLIAGGRAADDQVRSDAELVSLGAGASPLALPSPRASFTLTVLDSGTVLMAGGDDGAQPAARADLLDASNLTWRAAPPLAVARAGHTATLLRDGSVLVVGGRDAAGGLVAGAERFDPRAGAWSSAGTPVTARFGHTATRLRSGEVLVAGGVDAGSDELYDPVTNRWSVASEQAGSGRAFHTSTLLLDGRVLLTGGLDTLGQRVATAAIWNPAGTDPALLPPASMSRPRARHRALLLPSGRVLVCGGAGDTGPDATAEEFDPATRSWRALPDMAVGRESFTLTLLPDGSALAAGGAGGVVATDLYAPGRQGSWPIPPSLHGWPIAAAPGSEIEVAVSGLSSAPQASDGTAGSSNLDHPLFVFLTSDGDGAGIAPSSRWDESGSRLVVPPVGAGVAWLFPVVAGSLGNGVPIVVTDSPPRGDASRPLTGCMCGVGGAGFEPLIPAALLALWGRRRRPIANAHFD
jgi:hypothetical protein